MQLDKFLSALLYSFQNARAISDLSAIDLAQQYQQNPLLERLPVARMRLQDVELNLPIAMRAPQERDPKPEERNSQIDEEDFKLATYDNTKSFFAVSSFPRKLYNEYFKAIGKIFDEFHPQFLDTNGSTALPNYAAKIESLFLEIVHAHDLAEKYPFEKGKIQTYLQKNLSIFFEAKQMPISQNCEIIFESNEIRELPEHAIINLKVQLREEALEWHVSENDGEISRRLLPE